MSTEVSSSLLLPLLLIISLSPSVFSADLPTCPAETSGGTKYTKTWSMGACTPTTYADPPKPTTCSGKAITTAKATACHCPDDSLWVLLSGLATTIADYQCKGYDGTQEKDLLQATYSCSTPPKTTCTYASVSNSEGPGGRMVLSPTYPSTCTSASITFSSATKLATGQILIEPTGGIEWSAAKEGWKFAAGDGDKIVSMNGENVPNTSGQQAPPVEKFEKQDDGTWKMTAVDGVITRGVFAHTSSDKAGGPYDFSVTAVIPCDKPATEECNITSFAITADQWKAFDVDDFMDAQAKNYTAIKNTDEGKDGWFTWFKNTYLGDSFESQCSLDQVGSCIVDKPCKDTKTVVWRRQAYLTFAALVSLSRYLAFTYQAYDKADDMLQDAIPEWNAHFNLPEAEQTWKNIVQAAASMVGMLSVIGFAVAPFLAETPALWVGFIGGAVLFGMSSILNGAVSFANIEGVAATEVEFEGYAHAMTSMSQFINISQQHLIDQNNEYFDHGTNLSAIFKQGALVGDNLINKVVDSTDSGFVSTAASWFARYTLYKLVNSAWDEGGNYIVFVPYGPVKWFDNKEKNDFSSKDCKDLQSYAHFNDVIESYCDYDDGLNKGMAAFMYPQMGAQAFDTFNEKSYYEGKDSDGNIYVIYGRKWTPVDVFQSSLSSYFGNGFKYNASTQDIGDAITKGDLEPLKLWTTLNPWDAGVFNLAVCVMRDMTYFPGCEKTQYSGEAIQLSKCWTAPSICKTNVANWTGAHGEGVQYFRDWANPDIIKSYDYVRYWASTQPPKD
ncbi:uncharacterized protein KY384_008824 [Bacidia gigantensis]|uniref:uncharacterized protein n=1 Tax=Bacidia gigantensis TaxID=2732470 RepID=UPI001D058294|nr:uncharacterized protein KY384_008824 [Bacidia gigantensis]KAG8526623.1 hypothetical protein KY384_008824 [Bacidia gigantensis]